MSWDTASLLQAAREDVRKHPDLRLGQALYNAAYRRNPGVAHLAGTTDDPFYDDARIGAFLERLRAAGSVSARASLPDAGRGEHVSETPRVEVGQRWRSKDRRDDGRVVTVEEVEEGSTGYERVHYRWVVRRSSSLARFVRAFTLVSAPARPDKE